jgi:hypothetical protein
VQDERAGRAVAFGHEGDLGIDGAVVTAKVPDEDYRKYADIMDRSAFDIAARESAYRETGWKGYDPAAVAYTADQVRVERESYRR